MLGRGAGGGAPPAARDDSAPSHPSDRRAFVLWANGRASGAALHFAAGHGAAIQTFRSPLKKEGGPEMCFPGHWMENNYDILYG